MSDTLMEQKQQLCTAGVSLRSKNLVARTWGNLSIKVDDDHFIISPSGILYDHVEPQHIAVVSIGDLSWSGTFAPSSEKNMHAMIYADHADIGAIVHTHQSVASSFAAAHKAIDENTPCAPYAPPSTKKLAHTVAKTMQTASVRSDGSKAVVLANHGVVIGAKNIEQAIAAAEQLEQQAQQVVQTTYKTRDLPKKGRIVSKLYKAYEQAQDVHSYSDLFYERNDSRERPSLVASVFSKRKDVHFVSWVKTPYTQAFSSTGLTLYPYLDDMAQIIGVKVSCVVDKLPWFEPGTRNAVFLEDQGALCFGASKTDVEAIAMVLEKASRSYIESAIIGKGHKISWIDSLKMRSVYKNKYSKMSAYISVT